MKINSWRFTETEKVRNFPHEPREVARDLLPLPQELHVSRLLQSRTASWVFQCTLTYLICLLHYHITVCIATKRELLPPVVT